MSFFQKMLGRKSDSPASSATSPTHALRLADPHHPARAILDEAARMIDRSVELTLAGDNILTHMSFDVNETLAMAARMDEVISQYPDDMDLQVAKACLLYAGGQFKSAEETLDRVLSKAPDHFEARMWKNHWETWWNAVRFPGWSEQQTTLHPVMEGYLRQKRITQIVRDGMQKALVIVLPVQGPPLHPQAQLKAEWVLSKTPLGPLVAYYMQINEPGQEPNKMEAFLSIFEPKDSPQEGFYLMQQLAFTPYYFGVLVQNDRVVFNRRIVLGPRTQQKVRAIVAELEATKDFTPQGSFQQAANWHMSTFDMDKVEFE